MISMDDHDRRRAKSRHTNAAAAFTLLAALLFLGGTVSFGAAVEKKAPLSTQAAAATPLMAGSLSAGLAYVSRKRAAALRRLEAAAAGAAEGAAGEYLPPAA